MEEPGSAGVDVREQSGPSWAALAKALPAAALAAVGIIFAVQNVDSIDVDFLVWSFELPLVVIMLVSALIGGALWQVGLILRRRRRS